MVYTLTLIKIFSEDDEQESQLFVPDRRDNFYFAVDNNTTSMRHADMEKKEDCCPLRKLNTLVMVQGGAGIGRFLVCYPP